MPTSQSVRCAMAGAVLLFALELWVAEGVALSNNNAANGYPEKGTVVAVSAVETTDYVPISPPDSKGRTHGGEAFIHRKQVYRVQTGDGVYELEGGKHPTMAVGETVEFRVAARTVWVLANETEKKYQLKARLSATAP